MNSRVSIRYLSACAAFFIVSVFAEEHLVDEVYSGDRIRKIAETGREVVEERVDATTGVKQQRFRLVHSLPGTGVQDGRLEAGVVRWYKKETDWITIPAAAPAGATPAPALAKATGTWTGQYRNTLGGGGSWTVDFVEGAGGNLTGTDDGVTITFGRRDGDTFRWNAAANDRAWSCTAGMTPDGRMLTVHYKVKMKTNTGDVPDYTGQAVLTR